MVDFYFVTTLVNMIWQIFTVLFVLYRFTSFFSMMYNFIQFLGKLLKGVIYVKDQIALYISKRRGYSFLNEEELNGMPRRQTKSFWQKSYDKIRDWIFGKPRSTSLPLYETRTSYIHNFGNTSRESHLHTTPTSPRSPRSSKADTDFENLLDSNYDSREFYPRSSKYNMMASSSLYPPPKRPYSQPSSSSLTIPIDTTDTTDTTDTKDTRDTRDTRDTKDTMNKSNEQETERETQKIYSPLPQKPFNVQDINMLFNSQFLTKILNPFKEQEDIEDNEELEQALLKNSYDDGI